MRRTPSPGLLLFVVWAAACVPAQAQVRHVGWMTDFDAALAEAQRQQRPLLVHFYADWCPPCQQMKKSTLPDAAVKQSLAKYVPVMIDIDQQPGVAQKFGVRSVPTFMAVESDGTVLKMGNGGMPASAFTTWLNG